MLNKITYGICSAVIAVLLSSPSVAQKTVNSWQLIPSDENKSISQLLPMTKDNALVKFKSTVDEMGNLHERFYQTYNGYRVNEGDYVVHYKNGRIHAMNGSLVENISLNTSIIIEESKAIEAAINDAPPLREGQTTTITKTSTLYNTEYEQALKGNLSIISLSGQLNQRKDYYLAYEFNLSISNSDFSKKYIVDAITGKVLSSSSNRRRCNIGTGTGTTFHNGNQTFKTQWTGSIGRYKLFDDCRKIDTYYIDPGGTHNYKDWDNNWTDQDDKEGISAHWAMQRAFDYFEYAYNLTGPDGWYHQVNIFADHTPGDIYWQNDEIYIGGEDGSNESFTTLDMCGHEWTHGVNSHHNGLVYQDESGALDESFADIMGAMVEYYVEGFHSGTYLQGDDAGTRRSLSNPAAYNDPSIYLGTNWYTGTNDFGGVHTNSGVQNHWFYLLAEGGSQTVSGTTYTVTGIGIENAAYVAYKNLRDYITSNAQYADAKNGAIMAAIDIWGECDWKTEQVINAWNAVGVSSVTGINYNLNVPCGSVTLFHNAGLPFNLKALNNMTSYCTYEWGKTTNLSAGNEIRFYAGSHIKGGNFRAHINPCLTNNMRTSSYPSSYGGIGNTPAEINEEDVTMVLLENDASIYPNPNNGNFTININKDLNISAVEITDLTGRIVYVRDNINDNTANFELEQEENGVYMVKIISGSNVIIKKVIKR